MESGTCVDEAEAASGAEAETVCGAEVAAAAVAGVEVWAPGSGGGSGTWTHWPRNQVVPAAEAEAARVAEAETAFGTAACVTEAETAFGIIAATLGISGTTYLSIISAGIPA